MENLSDEFYLSPLLTVPKHSKFSSYVFVLKKKKICSVIHLNKVLGLQLTCEQIPVNT